MYSCENKVSNECTHSPYIHTERRGSACTAGIHSISLSSYFVARKRSTMTSKIMDFYKDPLMAILTLQGNDDHIGTGMLHYMAVAR